MQILKKRHYRLVPKVTLLYCAIFSTLDHLDPNNKPKRDFGKEIRSNFELWPLCVGSNLQILRKNTVLILDLFPGSSSFIVPIFVRIGRVIFKWQTKNGNLLLALPPPPAFWHIWPLRVRSIFEKRRETVVYRVKFLHCVNFCPHWICHIETTNQNAPCSAPSPVSTCEGNCHFRGLLVGPPKASLIFLYFPQSEASISLTCIYCYKWHIIVKL